MKMKECMTKSLKMKTKVIIHCVQVQQESLLRKCRIGSCSKTIKLKSSKLNKFQLLNHIKEGTKPIFILNHLEIKIACQFKR